MWGAKQWQHTKREIREIFLFSSPSCLTGSFVRERITTEIMSIHLDLNKSISTFKKLAWKDWITNTISTCLRDNLLKNLSFHSPHLLPLEVFFLHSECLMMLDFNNWESLMVLFTEAVCKMINLQGFWRNIGHLCKNLLSPNT